MQSIIVGDENESFGSIGDQPITRKDIRTLRGLTWLNDEVNQIISINPSFFLVCIGCEFLFSTCGPREWYTRKFTCLCI